MPFLGASVSPVKAGLNSLVGQADGRQGDLDVRAPVVPVVRVPVAVRLEIPLHHCLKVQTEAPCRVPLRADTAGRLGGGLVIQWGKHVPREIDPFPWRRRGRHRGLAGGDQLLAERAQRGHRRRLLGGGLLRSRLSGQVGRHPRQLVDRRVKTRVDDREVEVPPTALDEVESGAESRGALDGEHSGVGGNRQQFLRRLDRRGDGRAVDIERRVLLISEDAIVLDPGRLRDHGVADQQGGIKPGHLRRNAVDRQLDPVEVGIRRLNGIVFGDDDDDGAAFGTEVGSGRIGRIPDDHTAAGGKGQQNHAGQEQSEQTILLHLKPPW